MGSSNTTREARLRLGLCTACGAKRAGEGITKWYCAACSEKDRGSKAERVARWREQGRCIKCGGARDAADNAPLTCATCRAYFRKHMAARRTRERQTSYYGAGRNGGALPVGFHPNAPRVNAVCHVRVRLDFDAVDAIYKLRRRDRCARERALKPGERLEILFQTSRIVREAICRMEHVRAVPVRRVYHFTSEERFHFRADARTLAVIERHQTARAGDVSATVCDLLVYAAKASFAQWSSVPRKGRD